MGLNFLNGMASAYRGYKQGGDEELTRQQTALDRQNAAEDRQYNMGQRQRTLDAQGRADTMRTDLAGITDTEAVTTPQAGPGLQGLDGTETPLAPMTTMRAVTPEQQARRRAAAYSKGGDMKGYFEQTDAANKEMFARATQQTTELERNAPGMNIMAVAQAGAAIFSGDSHAGKVENIRQNADGSVSLTAVNQQTGERIDKTYKTGAEMVSGLKAHYSPEVYGQLRAQSIEAAKVSKANQKTDAEIKYMGEHGQALLQGAATRQSAVDARGTRAGTKADHFDEKEWDRATKVDASTVSLMDDTSGKPVRSTHLASAYLQAFNEAKAGGKLGPNEAIEYATTTVSRIKDAAQNRVDKDRSANKNSTLTLDKATRDLFREAAAAPPSTPQPTMQSVAGTSPPRGDVEGDKIRAYYAAQDAKKTAALAKMGDINKATPTSPTAQASMAASPALQSAPKSATMDSTLKKPLTSVEQVQAKSLESLRPLSDQLKQVKQQFVSAAQAGDQQAATKLVRTQEALRVQLESLANEKFGNGAAEALRKISM